MEPEPRYYASYMGFMFAYMRRIQKIKKTQFDPWIDFKRSGSNPMGDAICRLMGFAIVYKATTVISYADKLPQ